MDYSEIKLVVTDMDGTLLNSKGDVSPEFYSLFKKLRKENILFAIASGRQYYSLTDKLKDIKDELIFIAENGAIVIENEKQLHIQPMLPEMAHNLIRKVKEIGGKHLILSGPNIAYIEGTNPEFLKEVSKHYKKYEVVDDLTKVKLDQYLKITICDLTGAEENTYPFVKDLKDNFQVKLSGKIWIDFTHKLAEKGNALKKVQEIKGIAPEDTMTFGDYFNDIELFDHSKYSFAMENAHQEVKKAANYETKSNDENGVEFVLESLLKDLKLHKV